VFGKPPRWFSYAELEYATGGFSRANFLAEGGFGSVHRGVLPDGQAIAVKQYKLASSQGDVEFCSEVEVLSCAQHRNVVMLIGFCVEDKRRLLVYEYICNRSLDTHLYGKLHFTFKTQHDKSFREKFIGSAFMILVLISDGNIWTEGKCTSLN
jgi:serine/threonine protein kinase